ncbi:MAG: glycosyltransferase, partial [Candidatus Heimdallarchaeaceae archaeon]
FNQEIIKDYPNLKTICAKRPRLRELGYKTKLLVILELLKLDKLLFFPDLYYPWIKKAVKKGLDFLKNQQIDAIVATAPPYSTFVVGYELSKKLDLPLILDYRDPWGGNPFLKYPFQFTEKRAKRLEKKIIEQAGMIVTVGHDYAKLIAENNNISPSEFEIIYNGFFFEDIQFDEREKEKNKFTISFFGNFYLIQKPVVQTFLEALGDFIRKYNLGEKDIVFQYAGNTSRKVIQRMLRKGGIENYYHDLGFLSKKELYEEINKSNLVIDIVPKGTEYMIHTKVYDYAVGNSHILLIGESGAIVDLCRKIEQKYTIEQNNKDKIVKTLEKLYNLWKNGELEYGCNQQELQVFSRKNQAKKLACILMEKFT